MKRSRILLILLSIVSISLSIYCFYLHELTQNLMTSKNFHFDWSPTQETLAGYWKSNNKIASQFIDRNFDNNYEMVSTFTTYGKIYNISNDKNENGVFESIDIFNSISEKVGNCIDSDEDGATDQFSLILDNGKTLTFKDIDIDGRYEEVILNDNVFLIDDLFQ